MADLNNLLGNLHDEEDGGEDEDEYNMRKKGQFYEDDEDDEIRNNKTYNTTDTQFYPDGITSVPTVYGQLKIAWNQELACPELMPYPQELMDYFLNLVATQEDVIAADTNRTIALDILKIELDRVKFILADLLRTRIHKIEKYALYNRNVLNRMSDDEVKYLQGYGKLLERHLNRTVLNHIPRNFARLDMPEMIDKPNFDDVVFCQMLESIELREETNQEDTSNSQESFTITTPDTGTTYIARYSAIRQHVLDGKVILLS